MPITKSVTSEKKKAYRTRGKSATSRSVDVEKDSSHKTFLTIAPALPNVSNSSDIQKAKNRSNTTLEVNTGLCDPLEDGKFYSEETVCLQNSTDGKIHAFRTENEKESHPDRICLDRRGLSLLPIIDGEPKLRLLSLQHNMLIKLDGLHAQNFNHLIFFDIYDNQLDRISSLDTLVNLRVLLMGKNRIKRIEGLKSLTKLEVLDLHGNQISHVSGLSTLSELKVLNLAGNQIKIIGINDLKGLSSLREINLRRNKIKKLLGFGETPQLEKLFLSNNDMQNVEDIRSIAKATNLREITIDNNPVSMGGDCISFLVSYLPNLLLLSSMQVTEQVRKVALTWRRSKEISNAAFMDLTSDVSRSVRREEVISNARTNWELLRSQTKCLTSNATNVLSKDFKVECDFVITPINNTEMNNSTSLISKNSSNSTSFNTISNKAHLSRRSQSQDTDNSQNTSSSNTSTGDFFRLPPLLLPIISKMEKKNNIQNTNDLNFNNVRRWESLSSVSPNIDSSVSSLPSSISSTSDEESETESKNKTSTSMKDSNKPITTPKLPTVEPELKITSTFPQSDTCSNLSVGTSSNLSNNSFIAGSSCSETTNSSNDGNSVRKTDLKRNIKSAVSNRRHNNPKLGNRAVTAKPKQKQVMNLPCPPTQGKDREQGGDYLVEISGRYLNVFGQGALRFIDRPWNSQKANDVNTVKFTYVNFNSIVPVFNKLRNRFPNADHFIFRETNINCLGQLNALAEAQGLSSLQIDDEGNPITHKKWRSYAIYRLSHWGLRIVNGNEVTEEDVSAANEEFQGLSDLVLWSLPDVLLHPLLMRLHLENSRSASQLSAKKWLWSADPALRSVVGKEALQWRRGALNQEDLIWRQKGRHYLGNILDVACNTVNKLNILEKEWPSILHETVQNTLLDYSQLDTYMKQQIQHLK